MKPFKVTGILLMWSEIYSHIGGKGGLGSLQVFKTKLLHPIPASMADEEKMKAPSIVGTLRQH